MTVYLLIIVGFLYGPAPRVVTSIDAMPSVEACQDALVDTMHKISLTPQFAQTAVTAHCEKAKLSVAM